MTTQSTRQIIGPILTATYGKGGMVHALADHLAQRIDAEDWNSRGREYMIHTECWNWFAGGGTAENVARKIEEAVLKQLSVKPTALVARGPRP